MATEAEMRLHRCCFTGHRPQKLTVPERIIKKALEEEVKRAIDDGFTTFISGMAQGVDIWAAEIIIKLRKKYGLKLICASPFEGFENSWSEDWKRSYRKIIQNADLIKYICPSYSPACFQIRNEWMVDHSARVIAAWNGAPSGTKNTVVYAEKKGVEVRNILKNKE